MSRLFSSLTIRGLQIKNRIVVSPMCQYSAVNGMASDWHLVHLGSRAVGGAGIVFTEAVAVAPEGRISPADLGLWNDEQIAPLQRITSFITANGSIPAIQLAHAGRKGSTTAPWQGDSPILPEQGGWETIAPSALAFDERHYVPQEMTHDDIKRVVADFGAAAERALKAGFKIIEIHGAHGYLVNEFLSPLNNLRTDEYGGSFSNRTRFLFEVIAAIRAVWPAELPLFLRISASDWADGGWTLSDSYDLVPLLLQNGVDLVDCSSGGVVPYAHIPAKPGYQVPFAAAVRHAGILTGAVGIIVTAQQAEGILEAGHADLIFMARELLRDPYFPLRAARELAEEQVAWPVQYERARRKK
jgi:2,4-dienoyl-CoA reductase-like NADH-dependent reductase (Old Yellow Enzyme family)